MTMTGHKTRSVFERYNIVSEGDLRDAAARLDRAADTISDTIHNLQPVPAKSPSLSIIVFQCRGRDSNPHAPCGAQDFKFETRPGTMCHNRSLLVSKQRLTVEFNVSVFHLFPIPTR